MKSLILIAIVYEALTQCLAVWQYGYTYGYSSPTFTVIRPTYSGRTPDYVIVKPAYSALRAGYSVFKPVYQHLKPEYQADYMPRPSYSGLRPGLQPTYLADKNRGERRRSKMFFNPVVDREVVHSVTAQELENRLFIL